jgi:MraZ protein
MLLGHYITRLTSKGRTSIPVKFRREIGDNLVIARWYEGCLVIVDLKDWKALLDRLTGRANIISQPVRDIDRFILGSAFEIKLDSQGRFVVPSVLKTYAELLEEIVFIGLGDRIEIWSKKNWEGREGYVQKHASEMVEKLAKAFNRKEGD